MREKIVNKGNPPVDEVEFKKTAEKVSAVSIIGNFLLAGAKLLAGIIANSGAMISDAVHSASDVFSTIIVIIGIRLSAKKSDKEHPYGHERLECVAAIVLSIVLLVTGIAIGHTAVENIKSANYTNLKTPGILALIAAVVSIVCKEAMYWYTRYYARKIDSSALLADAWHHRSDALSSVGALIGIAFARMGYPVMDSVASLVIFIFIAKASYDIFKDAINKMVDHSCDEETEAEIKECVMKVDDVICIDSFQSRVFGSRIYVDVEIGVLGSMSLWDAHKIAENVHETIETNFSKVKHIMVHVNPKE